jgi:hypothetical protein
MDGRRGDIGGRNRKLHRRVALTVKRVAEGQEGYKRRKSGNLIHKGGFMIRNYLHFANDGHKQSKYSVT